MNETILKIIEEASEAYWKSTDRRSRAQYVAGAFSEWHDAEANRRVAEFAEKVKENLRFFNDVLPGLVVTDPDRILQWQKSMQLEHLMSDVTVESIVDALLAGKGE